MGGGELLNGDGICLIEWADRIRDLLPKDHLRIEIEVTGESTRVFRCLGQGALSVRAIQVLRQSLG